MPKTPAKKRATLLKLIESSPALAENESVRTELKNRLATMNHAQKQHLRKLLEEERERFDTIGRKELEHKTALIEKTQIRLKSEQRKGKSASRKSREAAERRDEEAFARDLLKKLDKVDRG